VIDSQQGSSKQILDECNPHVVCMTGVYDDRAAHRSSAARRASIGRGAPFIDRRRRAA
jgi:hypothetical protein